MRELDEVLELRMNVLALRAARGIVQAHHYLAWLSALKLIENALDAICNEGELKIVCRLEADMILVEIWDSGPGIPPELQDRIFEPFFTTKPPGQGLGLGLDNAMRIVRKHRGHLSVKSEPGSTCFRVRLPLDQLQAY